jgi:hypothetical protein
VNRAYRGRHEAPLVWVTDRDAVRRDAAERIATFNNYRGRHEAR